MKTFRVGAVLGNRPSNCHTDTQGIPQNTSPMISGHSRPSKWVENAFTIAHEKSSHVFNRDYKGLKNVPK